MPRQKRKPDNRPRELHAVKIHRAYHPDRERARGVACVISRAIIGTRETEADWIFIVRDANEFDRRTLEDSERGQLALVYGVRKPARETRNRKGRPNGQAVAAE